MADEEYSRVAIITGATSGIGEATARSFTAAGYGVVGNGRSAGRLEELEGELGPAFRGVSGDAAAPETVAQLFTSAHDAFGRPADIVVVNAGRGLGGSVTGADLAQFDDVLRINVSGALALMKEAAQRMLKIQEKGFPDTAADIVVLGSVVGRHISPFSAVYGASKAAVHSLAEGLRREVGPSGVRVSLVEPGAALTGFQAAAGYDDETVQGFKDKFGPCLTGEDVAETIRVIVSQPPHVHLSDVVVRPTRQAYP